ncbi:uncharacterized protein LACBIDRAFT_332084 [Laccaria bicolor S238N-H82]|uniref:Predicted protein n=1 Tax=Laccaria bicolor (strain S238N-H82 / ATCC MYA-4686) TaxID=486041 RepID=B0DRI6_LACBS|nr:uncharacterized protein LACBIDRAFT_332084 [Laccaria bicolor S238N-H82]EDR02878.1 predicted protein [Laccaria bicolor S238N-H82]|eukprot:XP_001886588.1 predicted protein [Laccaria bicolor S238N-H82]
MASSEIGRTSHAKKPARNDGLAWFRHCRCWTQMYRHTRATIGGGLVSSFGNFAVEFLCATTSDGIGEEGDECDDANGGERACGGGCVVNRSGPKQALVDAALKLVGVPLAANAVRNEVCERERRACEEVMEEALSMFKRLGSSVKTPTAHDHVGFYSLPLLFLPTTSSACFCHPSFSFVVLPLKFSLCYRLFSANSCLRPGLQIPTVCVMFLPYATCMPTPTDNLYSAIGNFKVADAFRIQALKALTAIIDQTSALWEVMGAGLMGGTIPWGQLWVLYAFSVVARIDWRPKTNPKTHSGPNKDSYPMNA